MSSVVESRRAFSDERLEEFKGQLSPAEKAHGERCCAYATGSYGRGEASQYSDLDVFIVGLTEPPFGEGLSGGKAPTRLLSRLDEICLKRDLIEATRSLELPEFSGGGEYLKHYTTHDLTSAIGAVHDDSTNTFTARLLLLLESTPILGHSVYEQAIRAVVDAYWIDFEGHENAFQPVFFINDILRLWRTFCVNYEHRTRQPATVSAPTEDDLIKKAKRKLKHYKLTHCRMMTCYSGIASLLDTFGRQKTVRQDDVVALTSLRPLARLVEVRKARPEVIKQVDAVVEQYEKFLIATDADEPRLVSQFRNPHFAKDRLDDARDFGHRMYALLAAIDGEGRLFQTLVV